MSSGISTTRHVAADPDAVYAALRDAAAENGVKITGEDATAHRLDLATGMDLTSWGEKITATVTPSDRGGSLVELNGTPKAGFATTSWGEDVHASALESKLFGHLERALG